MLAVAPFYAGGIRGGAEDVIARFIHEWQLNPDIELEVWSTATTVSEGWNNSLHQDPLQAADLNMRIFKSNSRSWYLWKWLHRRISTGPHSYFEARMWALTAISGVGMDAALKKNIDQFDVVYLPHYFYGSTHRLAPIAGRKALLHPFFHDEIASQNYAIKDLFSTVRYAIVNTISEKDTAIKNAQAHGVEFIEIGNIVDSWRRD